MTTHTDYRLAVVGSYLDPRTVMDDDELEVGNRVSWHLALEVSYSSCGPEGIARMLRNNEKRARTLNA